MGLGGMVSFSQPCCWQASLGKAVWLNTRTRSAATGRPCPRATGGGGEGCGAGPICNPRSVCSPRNVTPYLLQRRHLWYCGFGVQEVGGGRPPLALSWKWSTGPAEFEIPSTDRFWDTGIYRGLLSLTRNATVERIGGVLHVSPECCPSSPF